MIPGWLDTTEKRLKIAASALTIIVLSAPVGWWVHGYFAKASEISSVRQEVTSVKETLDVIKLELKIGQLENRRSVLRSELRQLASTPTKTAIEATRLAIVTDELRDVEKDIDFIRAVQARLPGSK